MAFSFNSLIFLNDECTFILEGGFKIEKHHKKRDFKIDKVKNNMIRDRPQLSYFVKKNFKSLEVQTRNFKKRLSLD